MTNIDEKRSLRLRQALRDMGNDGVKLREPEDHPFYDQPDDYEEEKKKFEPIQVEETEESESHEEISQTSYQETDLSSMDKSASVEVTYQRVGKSKVRERLADFQGKYLQPLHISHRKAVYVSEETQKRLGYVVRKIGEHGASISGYVEQVLHEHLDRYKDDVETWRKL